MSPDQVQRLTLAVHGWVSAHRHIYALGVVGSWARRAARPDSDLDLMLLVSDPMRFRAREWLTDINWARSGFQVRSFIDHVYGKVWSRHILLHPHAELELSFASRDWASTYPIDAGTRRVVADGMIILHDPSGTLSRLTARIRCI